MRGGQRREGTACLVGVADSFPDGANDVYHLPVRHPLAAGALLLLALGSSQSPLHAVFDALRRADRNVGLHATLPQSEVARAVGRVRGPPHAVLIDTHVAVRHADGLDVRIDEAGIPTERIGYRIDVVPATRVVSDEMPAQRGTDLHELERGLYLLDEHVDLDGAWFQAQVSLEGIKHAVPYSRVLRGLDLRQIEHH